jgi:hypothetical protein
LHLNKLSNDDTGSNVIDTGPSPRTTYVQRGSETEEEEAYSHWRQIAFLLNTPLDVEIGQEIGVEILLDAVCGIWCRVLAC